MEPEESCVLQYERQGVDFIVDYYDTLIILLMKMLSAGLQQLPFSLF